ncbi:MAG: hypothetical protein MJ237_00245 [bacterium]|nr:hypothetical protein [bacterium]
MQDVSFQGLTADLRKNILTKEEILRSVARHPKSKGFVGTLPNEWIQNIPKEERDTNIPKVLEMFASILKIGEVDSSRKIAKKIKAGLVKYKAISPDKKVKFTFLGVGGFGGTYKMKVGEKTYVAKLFDKFYEVDCPGFGNLSEQNNALYLNAKENSDWVKFYFGNLNEKNQFMITKYVSIKDKRPKKKINLLKKGLEYVDYSIQNRIRGYNIDYGGFLLLPDFPVNNKPAIRVIKSLLNMSIKEQDKLIENIKNAPQAKDYGKKMAGVQYVLNQRKPELPKNMGFFKELLYYFFDVMKA